MVTLYKPVWLFLLQNESKLWLCSHVTLSLTVSDWWMDVSSTREEVNKNNALVRNISSPLDGAAMTLRKRETHFDQS